MHTEKTYVGLHYTDEELRILEIMSRHKSNGKLPFSEFLHNRFYQLARTVEVNEQDPESILFRGCLKCQKKKRRYLIPAEVCTQITFLANRHCIPLSTAIDRFIVSPLFNEYREGGL